MSIIIIDEYQIDDLCRQIDDFLWPFQFKILPQFENITDDAKLVEDHAIKRMEASATENTDGFENCERAFEEGVDHYDMLKLGFYTAVSAWHATLYEFFFQQIRFFFYRNIVENRKEKFETYCDTNTKLEEKIESVGYVPTGLIGWSSIKELQLLCNVIKHGEGKSSKKLRKINPDIFISENGFDHMNLYKTTLLEITLNINEKTLQKYADQIKVFWRKFPKKLNYNVDS